MADGLDDFQKFRADLNEEILACGHIGATASSPSTTRPTKQTPLVPRRKSYWD